MPSLPWPVLHHETFLVSGCWLLRLRVVGAPPGPCRRAPGTAAVPRLRGAGAAGGEPRRARGVLSRTARRRGRATVPFGLMDAWSDGSGSRRHACSRTRRWWRVLRTRAQKLGVSASSLCHMEWAAVLARVSGRYDVEFGTVLFGRMQGGEGGDRMLGPFINTYPWAAAWARSRWRRASARRTGSSRSCSATSPRRWRWRWRSGVSAPARLFTALLNYRHSVQGHERRGAENAGARLRLQAAGHGE
jgi:hypothetical protein